MKKLFLSIIFCCFGLLSFSNEPHIVNIKLDINESEVYWKGSKISYFHDGIVNLKWGYLAIDHGKVAGGEFVIDMNTITCTDIEKDKKRKNFEDHLKNEDFFNVEKFPTAKLVITKAQKKTNNKYEITADLTIKEQTHSIEFDADIFIKPNKNTVTGISYEASAEIIIDRTKWGVVYKSGSYFKDLVANKAINDEIEFKIKLVSPSN
jgi:polyisoprenoid-binding protein YceI